MPSGGAVHVISGASPAPSHVYSVGMAAPSSHGPLNWSGAATGPANVVPVDPGAPVADSPTVVGLADVDEGDEVDEVVVEVVKGMNSVGGGATVVDVVVVVFSS